ncbi:MAG: hypothetical protein ACKOX6_01055 [Bdellovibrio sp.]
MILVFRFADTILGMTVNTKITLGKLYRPLEELGESVILDLELYDSNDLLVESFASSHAVNDGLSLLFQAINKRFCRNWKVPLGNLGSKNSSPAQRILRIFKALNRKQPPQSEFKLHTHAQPSKISANRKLKVDPDLVTAIAAYCQQNKVSENSFLATAVFKSYSQIFGLKYSRWMIPVNIRDRADQQVPLGMYSSYFLFPYRTEGRIEDVHRELKMQLQSGVHWANYYLGMILSWMPSSVLYWLTKRDFDKNTSDIVGSFSNLGSWPDLEPDLKNFYWAMYPTVRAHRPFGITVIKWADTLAFGMRLHSSVDQSEAKVGLFCEELKKNLREMSRS